MTVPDAGPYLVSTAAFAVENTHNFGGGTVQPLGELRGAPRRRRRPGHRPSTSTAPGCGTPHVATGVPLAELRRRRFDTVSVCLSRASARPSARCWRARPSASPPARVWRKRSAAACGRWASSPPPACYALDHQLARLADDHARARRLAEAVAATPRARRPGAVETNIVVLDLAAAAAAPDIAAAAREQGVLLSVLGPRHAAHGHPPRRRRRRLRARRTGPREGVGLTAPAVRPTVRPMGG